jgi:hypothetical protein
MTFNLYMQGIPEPVRSAGFSATTKTMFASRTDTVPGPSQRGHNPLQGSTAAASSFRHLAQNRKRDIETAMRTSEPSSSTTFHPALKASDSVPFVCERTNISIPGSKGCGLEPTRYQETQERGDPSPSHERQVKPKRAAKQTTYVFIFIPFTKDINRGHCNVPAPHL